VRDETLPPAVVEGLAVGSSGVVDEARIWLEADAGGCSAKAR